MTTKEELDEAIAHLAGVFIPDSGAVETALTIITKYRDGQLVEKSDQKDLLLDFKRWYDKLTPSQKCTVHPPAGSGASSGIFDKTDGAIVDSFLRPHQLTKQNPKPKARNQWPEPSGIW